MTGTCAVLTPKGHLLTTVDDMDAAREDTEDEKGAPIGVGTVAAAGLAAITLYLLEPIREVWIHGEAFAASRLSMMRIMARRMNAATVVA